MKLPNPDRAVVDKSKLRDYVLSRYHENGRHKARVFASALGLDASHTEWLRHRLLRAAKEEEVTVLSETRFGVIYVLDFLVTTWSGSAIVRSGWIVRVSEDFPRLTTCYVKNEVSE